MPGFVGRTRTFVHIAFCLSAAYVLTSCNDGILAPSSGGSQGGMPAPLAALSAEFDDYQFLGFVTDDQGANDTPAQSDLNAFTRADNVSGKLGVKWVWDDINSWTGSGQTGDGCALFDTDNDGKANAAVCVRITNPDGDATTIIQLNPGSPLVYTCSDTKADRCTQSTPAALAGTICEVEKIDGETFFPAAGEDGADVVAACSIPRSAITSNANANVNLLNVCSFPSGSPNSNPFDCVVTPGAGFLLIRKATTPQASGQTFSFTINPAPVVASLATQSIVDSTTADEGTSLISVDPKSSYSVTESTIPSGWHLSAASCAKQTTPNPTATGTKSGNAMTGVGFTSGETTVCTFTNARNQGTIELKKIWSGTPGQTTLNIGTSAGGTQVATQLTGAAGAAPLTTGAKGVNAGTYYVSESGGLANYSAQLECTRNGSPVNPGADNAVTVDADDVVVCTFTNTRNQGSIELKKVWVGDAGQTTLNIGTSANGSQIASVLTGAAGAAPLTTGAKTVNTGTYFLSESGGLTNYGAQLTCTNNGSPVTPTSSSVTVGSGDVVVCTFTNTRNQGPIELKKVWVGQGGQTTLNIGTSAGGTQVATQQTGAAGAAPLSTGAQGVNTGTYFVSETGGLAAYSAALACTSNGSPITTGANNSVSVTTGATVVCTFTNTVVPPTITVVKTAGSPTVPETGGSITYSVVVRNTSSFPVTLTSLVDDKFGNLSGKGTCNGSGNLYGSLAPNATYTCSFTEVLGASEPTLTHINEVTASVTSEGGPTTAADTARVTYSNVNPNISVAKSADITIITASGGTSVAGFNADREYSASGGGGGGTTTPTFAENTCDDAGANDTPEQSDLNCMSRADNVTGRLFVRWTWDDIDQWTGSGQTGDACALLDTDGDGNANSALCVRITNPNGDPNVIAQFPGSPILYKCGDNSAERCSSKVSPDQLNPSSVCTISKVPNQIASGQDIEDVEAQCNLRLQDLGNVSIGDIDLLNVCSFPSGSPNSNPFDCVVSPAAGFLVIREVTTPSTSAAYFAFTLRNQADNLNATATNGDDQFAVQSGATSAAIPMLAGSYKLKQEMPTNWTLTSISCTRDGVTVNGTTSPQAITIVQGSTTECTFTNVLTASQSVEFTVVVTNNSAEAVTLVSLGDSEDPTATTPTYPSLSGIGTCGTAGNPFGVIAGNGSYTCKFTRTIAGSPGYQHKNQVRAVGRDNENNEDIKTSNIVTVAIN